jgi:hypothetical protein
MRSNMDMSLSCFIVRLSRKSRKGCFDCHAETTRYGGWLGAVRPSVWGAVPVHCTVRHPRYRYPSTYYQTVFGQSPSMQVRSSPWSEQVNEVRQSVTGIDFWGAPIAQEPRCYHRASCMFFRHCLLEPRLYAQSRVSSKRIIRLFDSLRAIVLHHNIVAASTSSSTYLMSRCSSKDCKNRRKEQINKRGGIRIHQSRNAFPRKLVYCELKRVQML